MLLLKAPSFGWHQSHNDFFCGRVSKRILLNNCCHDDSLWYVVGGSVRRYIDFESWTRQEFERDWNLNH